MAMAIKHGPIRPITASQGPAQQPMPIEMPYRAVPARRAGLSPSPIAHPEGPEPTILRVLHSKEGAVLPTRVPTVRTGAAHTAVRAPRDEAVAHTAVPAARREAAVPTAAALPAAAVARTAAAALPAAAALLWVAVPQEEAVP